jgi:integrase
MKPDGPKRDTAARYELTVDEALRFVDVCTPSRFGLYFLVALSTGLRPEEGIALQWPNLELGERGVCHVKRVIHSLRVAGGAGMNLKQKTASAR